MLASMASVSFAKEDTEYFYVDVNAAETGSGTIDAPFKTLDEAKNAVRDLKRNGNYPENGVTVFLREGTYVLENTFTLNEDDAGEENAPVIWRSYYGEKAVLTTGVQIPFSEFEISDDTRIDPDAMGSVYSYNLQKNGYSGYDGLYITGHSQHYFWNFGMAEEGEPQFGTPAPEVFLGEDAYTLARYPNTGEYMKIDRVVDLGSGENLWYENDNVGHPIEGEMKGFTIEVANDRIERWKNAKHAWVWGYWRYDWSDLATPVKTIDAESKTLETVYPSPYEPMESQRWYIYNLLEELDVPGEWFYDEDNGEMYIYPADGFSSNDKVTLAFQKKNVINLENTENIELYDLTITGTRSDGLLIQDCNNIDVTYLEVTQVSGNGIKAEGENIRIRGCHVYTVGQNAITISGGNSETLEKSNNLVENNWTHNFARMIKTYMGGIQLGGCGITVRNNLIYDGPHTGMPIGGNDHLIERNEIHSVLKEASDMGAIYSANIMVHRGTVIRNNVIHDLHSNTEDSIGVFGVYIDNRQSGYTIESNVFYNYNGIGASFNMGRDNIIRNNIFANIKQGVVVGASFNKNNVGTPEQSGITEELINSEPYQKYPNIKTLLDDDWYCTKYNVVEGNLNWNVEVPIRINLNNVTEAEFREVNTVIDGYEPISNPGFYNIDKNNYTLVENNTVMEHIPEFENIDMSKCSTITSRLRRVLENNSIVFAVDKPVAYINWEKKTVAKDKNWIMPYKTEDTLYIPLRYAAEVLGSDIIWDDGKITIEYDGTRYILFTSDNKYMLNEDEGELSDIISNRDGRTYISAEDFAQLFNYELFTDEDGLIILTEENIENDLDDELNEELKIRLR